MKTKNLYLTASIKWKWIHVLLKKRKYNQAEWIAEDYCSFCRDVIRKHGGFPTCTGKSGCSDYCAIDKSICGTEDSLVVAFYRATEINDQITFASYMKEDLIDMYSRLK